ncbi:MAG: tyrosine-type recombinase/integrase [Brevundimonas sp.]
MRTLKDDGRYSDGGGLYLVVRGGRKTWVYMFSWRGKRREMGLGRYPEIDLATARDEAEKARRAVTLGEDPIRLRRPINKTFESFAKAFIEARSADWTGERTRYNWERDLLVHAKGLLDMDVADIDTSDIVKVLSKLWKSHHSTAKSLQGRLETLFDAAKVQGLRTGENPARWRGHLKHLMPKKRALSNGHFAAAPYAEAPDRYSKLVARGDLKGVLALRLTIVTVSRSKMVRGMRWDEIKGSVWTVPAERMKMRKPFAIPLSKEALGIIAQCRNGTPFVFPGRTKGNVISRGTMIHYLDDVTVHGWRSTFRDWAGDRTDHARDVIETAMAHEIGSESERAYRRGKAFDKRSLLMDDWASYLTSS